MESRELSCVHLPKTLEKSTGPVYRFLMNWINCLSNKVFYCLYAATIQPIDNRREQMLRLDTKQLTVIRDLCTKRTDLHHVMGMFEEINVRVLKLNVSPKFALMKQVVLNVFSAQSTLSSSISNINKRF